MRVALLTDGIAPYVTGGMQRHSFYLCKYLVTAGVHVDLYHCDPNKKGALELDCFSEEEKKLITNEVVEFPAYGSLPGHYIRESYEYARRVYNRMARNAKPDFIYAKGFTAWEILNQKSKGKEFAPVGVNFHGYEMFQEQPGLLSWMKSKLLLQSPVLFNVKNADYLFSYGGKITDVIASLGIKRERIVEIPGGINPDWITKEALSVHSPVRFLFVGRNERRKGIEELNAVIRKLNQDSRDKFIFEFIGPIPPTKQVKGCEYHGEITGADALKEIYRRCDVLVVPSHSEGMPNVILEGMASGLAVVATNVGAVAKLVGDDNGWLLEKPSEELIHEVLLKIINCSDNSVALRKSRSVQKVNEFFTWDKIGAQTLDFMKSSTVASNKV